MGLFSGKKSPGGGTVPGMPFAPAPIPSSLSRQGFDEVDEEEKQKISWHEWTVLELREMIEEALEKNFNRTFFIWGPPAVGKSAVIKQACKRKNRLLIDDRLSQKDPTDVRGVLCPGPDGQAQWLITPEYKPLWNGETPVCLFYDEHNHAADILQKASYEISWDHSIGGVPFKKEVVVLLAGNREIDNANITPMDKPMQSRVIHVYVKFDAPVFLDYAEKEGAFHPLVMSYLRENPSKIYAPGGDAKQFYGDPLPRTWEMTSDVLRTFSEKYWDKMIAGCVGVGEAIVFRAWSKSIGSLKDLVDEIATGGNLFAETMSRQYFVCQSLVDRYRTNKALGRRILEYATAMKKKMPELGGVMLNNAYYVNSDTLQENKKAWAEVIELYKNFLT